MEKKAIYISTSEEGQLKTLSCSEKNLQKRTVKRPLFYDELNESSENGTLNSFTQLFSRS